jgi:trimethylamine---corrinoid protein Co-methyltransferase
MIEQSTTSTKERYGNEELYQQIQQDALLLIESYGVAVSPEAIQKLFAAMAPEEAEKAVYSEDTGRIYITQEVIEESLEKVREGKDFFPKGFGTGGMAAYIVDENGTRSPESTDIKLLAEKFGESDLLTSMQSSFNVCSRVKKKDIATRAKLECQAIDDMIAGANGKLIVPTLLSDAGYDKLKDYSDKGHRVGAALSIIGTYMTLSDEMVDPFLNTVNRGLPFIMNSMPIGGLTAPYSMSSLATMAQAEGLFGIVLGQLISPGIKCLNSAMPTIADMTSKDMPMKFGSISNTMVNILLAELNIYFGIPTCQSSCSHQRNELDEEAIVKSNKIFNLVRQYDFHMLRHMFGFSSQLNDFSIKNMERQLAQFEEVLENPQEVELPEPAEYDPEGLDAIFEGFERRDFRSMDHTLKNIGKSFVG